MHNILSILLVAIVAGGALYLFNLLPLDATVKKVASVLVVVIVAVWALRMLVGLVH